MQYSDTINKNGVIQRIEGHAGFDDGVISGDATLLKKVTGSVNETVYEMTSEIILGNGSFDFDDPTKLDYPIATTPLVASQRDLQFSNISFLRLKRVDISYDGTHFYRATPFDSSSYMDGLGNDTLTDQNFEKAAPMYDPKAFGFWLYPMASADDVAAGAKARIEYERGFTEYVYTDTTKEPPIDRPFHDLIAAGTVLRLTNVPADRYAKAQSLYGQKTYRPDGTYFWTGGMGQMLKHYGQRNEDADLTFCADFRSQYT